MLIDFQREREGERERYIDVRGKHQLAASYMHPNQDWTHNLSMCHDQELNLQTQFMGQCSNQLGHIGKDYRKNL